MPHIAVSETPHDPIAPIVIAVTGDYASRISMLIAGRHGFVPLAPGADPDFVRKVANSVVGPAGVVVCVERGELRRYRSKTIGAVVISSHGAGSLVGLDEDLGRHVTYRLDLSDVKIDAGSWKYHAALGDDIEAGPAWTLTAVVDHVVSNILGTDEFLPSKAA